jgi:hypothetical protein
LAPKAQAEKTSSGYLILQGSVQMGFVFLLAWACETIGHSTSKGIKMYKKEAEPNT